MCDRAYKEQHRQALTKFYQTQVQQRYRLPEKHFWSAVRGANDVDVLLITGMRDEAPVATFCHLVPESRFLDIMVTSSKEVRLSRRGHQVDVDDSILEAEKDSNDHRVNNYCPSFTFSNDKSTTEDAKILCERHILPLLHPDMQRFADFVRSVSDFPRLGIEFRHVLNIPQEPEGLVGLV